MIDHYDTLETRDPATREADLFAGKAGLGSNLTADTSMVAARTQAELGWRLRIANGPLCCWDCGRTTARRVRPRGNRANRHALEWAAIRSALPTA